MRVISPLKILFFMCMYGCMLTGSTGLAIDNDAGTVSYSNATSIWEYSIENGAWTWLDIATSNLWAFDADSGIFQDYQTGERWIYDDTYRVWVNTFESSYDLTTSNAIVNQVWALDDETQRWHPVRRSFSGGHYSFVSLPVAYWQYLSDTDEWHFVRSVGAPPTVPVDETWTFQPSTQIWSQNDPITGSSWMYRSDNANGQWKSLVTGEWWRFERMTDTQSQWNIVGNVPPSGWDYVRWMQTLSIGVWTSRTVAISPPATGLLQLWHYSNDDYLWHNASDLTIDPVEIVPLFLPTPFAQYKAVIDHALATLSDEGVRFGSDDGTGAGFIDETQNSLFKGGVFVFDFVTKMIMTNTVTLSGDIELLVESDAVLTLGDDSSDDVVIKPSDDATYAHLIFNVVSGKTLEIDVVNNVYFQASATVPLLITFRGKGTTIFRLPSGVTLSFGPESADSSSVGVCVQVLMDLDIDDISIGMQQVIFEPWSYAQEDSHDEGARNTATNKTTWIRFGTSSSLRFISYNATGTDDSIAGYGALAFDVCHAGTGRTILDLAPGVIPGLGYDAGINIWGSLIVGTGEDSVVTTSDLRTKVYPHKRAGMLAVLSITDDLAFSTLVENIDDDAAGWVARGPNDRRGLVIVNNNTTYPYLASNLSNASSLETSDWAPSQKQKGYQPGFILGDNGQLRVGHNLFLDYVAGAINQAVDPLQLGGADATSATVKLHNPSAFIVDQLGVYGASVDASYDMTYAGTSYGTMVLEGTAGCYFRCGASWDSGVIDNVLDTDSDTGAETLDATIGVGVYDGTFCPVLDVNGVQSHAESIWIDRAGNPFLMDDDGPRCLDGEHVLDIEGEFSIVSVIGRFGFPPNGYITLPSIRIDYTGQENNGVLS
ncbi:MAG: hypothetical protein QG604_539 [Candidatus Dependentiae bacterium]|nr:hypothetical protein [Candidatus Dependentiae bacterium]